MGILIGEIEADADVLEELGPSVFFREFGDSALNFRVMYWVEAPDNRLSTLTDLLCPWAQRFAEAGIEIPFPQRDIHMRSGNPSPAAEPDSTNPSKLIAVKSTCKADPASTGCASPRWPVYRSIGADRGFRRPALTGPSTLTSESLPPRTCRQ